ncbi:MAG: cation-translocating P-type ATPase, partial [Candidatus Nanohaloarchaea archaeon]
MQWHARQESEVIQELESSEEGLKSGEAERRLEAYGENSIRQGEEVSPLKIFLSQFQGFLIYLLVFAALLSLGVGLLPHHSPEFTDAALILLILLANGIFGFVQDYKAEKSIEALKDMSQPDATVLRDGERAEVEPEGIVPGDVIVLEQGDAIPADARIIESSNLETDESALTGESEKVHKNPEVLDEDAALAERGNMVYMNTHVVKGRGKAVVVETGMETQVGEIAEQIEEAEEEKTPFQEEVDELGKRIGTGIMAIIALVGVIQFFATGNIIQVLLVAITLAVAAVPEGLPAVVTLTLAMGSKKMLEKNALVRSLPVVESLGSVNYIVTDKTGTLTEGEMTVTKLYYQDEEIEVTGGARGDGTFKKDSYRTEEEYLEPLLECGTICNNVREKDGEFQGEPTEVALMVSARKADIEPEGGREYEVPFSSDRKRMTVVQDGTAYMKGAPETVLERCDRILIDEEVRELDQEMRQRIKQENSEFASEALRVLGFARRDVENLASMKDDEIESGMVFLGLQGMIDPPRTEVPEAVNDCRNAGINVVMATGDNVETAKAIGEEIGFDSEAALTGPELDKMSEEEIGEAVRETEVFARVSPENKVDILE